MIIYLDFVTSDNKTICLYSPNLKKGKVNIIIIENCVSNWVSFLKNMVLLADYDADLI